MVKICVLGCGSFGTALGCVLARNGHTVCMLSRSEDIPGEINLHHRNPRYFSDVILPETLSATTEPQVAFEDANYILYAIPVQQTPDYIAGLLQYFSKDLPIISCSKGLHATRLKYMSELIPEVLGYSPPMAFFSGPSFARELLDGQPTAVIVASEDENLSKEVQDLFSNDRLRLFTCSDVVGAEVGGALKNVFAIGAGIIQGMGLGNNTMAAFVTRGCTEMRRLAIAMGALPDTLAGLSGIGDLMLTCYGSLSRNRTVGFRLGEGESLQEILDSMTEVAEGVHTTPAALELTKKFGLDLPIIAAVASVLEGSISTSDAVRELMKRPLTAEFHPTENIPL